MAEPKEVADAEELDTPAETDQGTPDGGGGDEAEVSAEQPDDQENDGEQEVVDDVAAQPSRAETRVQRLANEAKAAREEAAQTRRELDEYRRQQQGRQQELTAAQEQERLLLMTPEERSDYKLATAQRTFDAKLQQMEFRTSEAADKAAFQARAATDPVYEQYADEVEQKLQELRSGGQNIPRAELLKWIIGDKALSGAKAATQKAKASGQKRIAAQQVRPGNAKGDTASQRGKATDTPAKRLEGVLI